MIYAMIALIIVLALGLTNIATELRYIVQAIDRGQRHD